MKGRKGAAGSAQPSQEFPAADSSSPDEATGARRVEPCYFCREQPSGPSGHAGLSVQVFKIPPQDRSFVPVRCAFCSSQWVRRRINARTYEWLRVAE